jgi:hypothetical protein
MLNLKEWLLSSGDEPRQDGFDDAAKDDNAEVWHQRGEPGTLCRSCGAGMPAFPNALSCPAHQENDAVRRRMQNQRWTLDRGGGYYAEERCAAAYSLLY